MWKIKVVTENIDHKSSETLCFAGQELRKYLSKSTSEPIIIGDGTYEEEGVILIGIGLRDDVKNVKDPLLDDAIYIDIKDRTGIITGVNARSVLIAVYRYLRELGYIFIRPGANGEKVPSSLIPRSVFVNEKPSYRHRGVCIEGSVSYESVEAMIDWLPKVGMNGYYIQFFTPFIFFKRWYSHAGYEFFNRYLSEDKLSVDDINGMMRMLEREIEKRSLICYKVGHGWTCEPFGTTSYGWEPVAPESIPEGTEKYFALVNGKRGIQTTGRYAYVPMMVQLCYGNPEVRRIMVDYFVEYCKANPQIDYVSFALADGTNGQCECELCRDTTPADFMVMIINEIDRRLTAENINTRLVISMYSDMLWPPVKYKIENSDRCFAMFAPFNRTYTHPLTTKNTGSITEFKRNKLVLPSKVEEVLSYYHAWHEAYSGETGVFDYYYMWDCYKDLGRTSFSRIIHEDIKNYKDNGFTGLISCQGQRVFCPTSLGMNMMAHTLWNRDCDYNEVCDYVFRAEFGEDFGLVRDYFEKLSEYSMPAVTRLEKPYAPENIPTYEKGLAVARAFHRIIEDHIDCTDNCEAVSWKYLKFHNSLSIKLLNMFIEISNGADPISLWAPLEDFVSQYEWELREYFDVFEFKYTYWRAVLTQINKDDAEVSIG